MRYNDYKDSGEQWLGGIPSHWKMHKMKFVFKERSDKGMQMSLYLQRLKIMVLY